jgi:hypothetical protein
MHIFMAIIFEWNAQLPTEILVFPVMPTGTTHNFVILKLDFNTVVCVICTLRIAVSLECAADNAALLTSKLSTFGIYQTHKVITRARQVNVSWTREQLLESAGASHSSCHV